MLRGDLAKVRLGEPQSVGEIESSTASKASVAPWRYPDRLLRIVLLQRGMLDLALEPVSSRIFCAHRG